MTNNNYPLVSVVIACYNCEKYVEMAVQSIIDQTYKNLEILITDDCSTDNSFNLLKQLTEKDSRILLFKNDENLKLAKSLNNMIAVAKGKYIARMDADDISLPERIEKQVTWMEANPDYVICGTNAWYINESGRKFRTSHLPCTNEEISKAKYIKCPFLHPSVIIKSDIAKVNKYDEEYFAAQDYNLWFSILEVHKGYNLKEKLLLYRDHSESVTNKKKDGSHRLLVNIFSEYLTNYNYSLSEKYVYGFLTGKKIDDTDLNVLILGLFNQIKSCDGFNFYILLRCFKFYFNNKKTGAFMHNLSVKEKFKFFAKLVFFFFNYIFAFFKKNI